jgi:hypothetical protein
MRYSVNRPSDSAVSAGKISYFFHAHSILFWN